MTLISLSFSGSGQSIVCCTQTLLGAPAPGDFNTHPETQTDWWRRISKCLPKLSFLWWRRESLRTARNKEESSHCCLLPAPQCRRSSKMFSSTAVLSRLFRKNYRFISLTPELWPCELLLGVKRPKNCNERRRLKIKIPGWMKNRETTLIFLDPEEKNIWTKWFLLRTVDMSAPNVQLSLSDLPCFSSVEARHPSASAAPCHSQLSSISSALVC